MQQYQTLAGLSQATVIEKKSEFIADASPTTSEEEALAFLQEIKARHRTARHHVYAYSLRQDARQRYSDDGEPAKTAGLPILDVITHTPVTDCIIVVTRYFGGTLLGTGGLVRAYTSAAQAALQAAHIVTVQLCVTLTVTLPYPLYEPVLRLFTDAGASIAPPVYTDTVSLSATLPAGQHEALLPQIDELSRGQIKVQISQPFFTPF